MRCLGDLATVTGSATYRNYATTRANRVWSSDRDALNRLGLRWAGGDPNPRGWRTQASALGAVNASL